MGYMSQDLYKGYDDDSEIYETFSSTSLTKGVKKSVKAAKKASKEVKKESAKETEKETEIKSEIESEDKVSEEVHQMDGLRLQGNLQLDGGIKAKSFIQSDGTKLSEVTKLALPK